MTLQPDAYHVVEREAEITIVVRTRTLNRPVPDSMALAYLRQALGEQSDAELFGGITEVVIVEQLIHQDDIDNSQYPPCLRCQELFPCECTDAEVEAHTQMASAHRDTQLASLADLLAGQQPT